MERSVTCLQESSNLAEKHDMLLILEIYHFETINGL